MSTRLLPIRSAPRDKTPILLFTNGLFCQAAWFESSALWHCPSNGEFVPDEDVVGWLPLPLPEVA